MEKLNLPPIKRKMTKDQILNAWRAFYKGRHGIPESRSVSDAEILEQFAIEEYKGTLTKWLQFARK